MLKICFDFISFLTLVQKKKKISPFFENENLVYSLNCCFHNMCLLWMCWMGWQKMKGKRTKCQAIKIFHYNHSLSLPCGIFLKSYFSHYNYKCPMCVLWLLLHSQRNDDKIYISFMLFPISAYVVVVSTKIFFFFSLFFFFFV